jgi:hypothetical protein
MRAGPCELVGPSLWVTLCTQQSCSFALCAYRAAALTGFICFAVLRLCCPCAVLRCACAALCCAVLRCAALCCAVLRCAALCCAALCCAVLRCAVLCCAVQMEVPQARSGWSGGLVNLIPSTTGTSLFTAKTGRCEQSVVVTAALPVRVASVRVSCTLQSAPICPNQVIYGEWLA